MRFPTAYGQPRTAARAQLQERHLPLALVTVVLLIVTLAGSPALAQSADPATVSPRAVQQAASKAGQQAGQKTKQRGDAVRATLVSLPPIVQPGTTPAAPSDLASLVATFENARPGQKVVLEQRTSRGWRTEAAASQDAWGSAAFSVEPGTYRARTGVAGRTWTTGTVTARRWAPSFEETFSGTALDTTVWNDQKREHESVYAPRTCARVDPAARRVTGGVLQLGLALDPARAGLPCSYATERESGTSPYLLTSQVSTENADHFRYGIIAARMKPQQAKGMHSGFWLLPQDDKYVDGVPAAGTEIDVTEFWGENGRGTETVGSAIHYYNAGWSKVSYNELLPKARKLLGPGRDWWEEFHVFSVEWTPTEYIFRIDGRETYRVSQAVSQAPQYLVLSMLASDYELDELTADEIANDTAEVDWVRVYDATSATAARVTRGRAVADGR